MRAHSAPLSTVFGSTGRVCTGAAGGRSRVSGGGSVRVGSGLRTVGFGSAAATGRVEAGDEGASREGNVSGAAVAVTGAAEAAGGTVDGLTCGAVTTGIGAAALAATAEAGGAVTVGAATVGVTVVIGAGGVDLGQSAKAASAATTTSPRPPTTSGSRLDVA